jgi:hypothetical protein
MEDIEGIRYINTGDWVESCTAVVENFDGTMEILRWTNAAVPQRLQPDRYVPVVIEGGAAAA